ncbi:MAG: HPr kinase/phosphatase C-terminal domain-containing protein [Parvibaculum sp.]|nr:HPr kinase/phosphatase C-terminal domain-containing protein [Parvibaculum sp.]
MTASATPPNDDALYIHATCVLCGARALLLRGPSGAGKSDLAFRLIRADAAGETRLVADDQVRLVRDGDRLVASAPVALAGLIELRGLGLVTVPGAARGAVALIVDLVPREAVPRLAEPRHEKIAGLSLPVLSIHAFDATTPEKLRLALAAIPDAGFPGPDGRL